MMTTFPTENELMLACLAAHGSRTQTEFRPTQGQLGIKEARTAFVLRGTSLHRWSISQGLDPSHVRQAVRGTRRGPKARKLLEQVLNSVRGGQS